MWNYLTESIWNGIRLLAIGLIPGVLVVSLVQECSRSIRQWLISCLGRTGFIYLTMPGVVIHELSHLFFCLIFQHKIMKVNLFSPQEDGTLGMVQHSYDSRNIFHRIGNFFIGSAPVWGGLLAMCLASRFLLPESLFSGDPVARLADFCSVSLWSCWQSWLWLYLMLAIGSHIPLSDADFQSVADGIGFLVLLPLVFCIALGWVGNWEEKLIDAIRFLLWKLLIYGAIPIVFAGTIVCLCKILSRKQCLWKTFFNLV